MKPITKEPVRSGADAKSVNDLILAKREMAKQYREWRDRMRRGYANQT